MWASFRENGPRWAQAISLCLALGACSAQDIAGTAAGVAISLASGGAVPDRVAQGLGKAVVAAGETLSAPSEGPPPSSSWFTLEIHQPGPSAGRDFTSGSPLIARDLEASQLSIAIEPATLRVSRKNAALFAIRVKLEPSPDSASAIFRCWTRLLAGEHPVAGPGPWDSDQEEGIASLDLEGSLRMDRAAAKWPVRLEVECEDSRRQASAVAVATVQATF